MCDPPLPPPPSALLFRESVAASSFLTSKPLHSLMNSSTMIAVAVLLIIARSLPSPPLLSPLSLPTFTLTAIPFRLPFIEDKKRRREIKGASERARSEKDGDDGDDYNLFWSDPRSDRPTDRGRESE